MTYIKTISLIVSGLMELICLFYAIHYRIKYGNSSIAGKIYIYLLMGVTMDVLWVVLDRKQSELIYHFFILLEFTFLCWLFYRRSSIRLKRIVIILYIFFPLLIVGRILGFITKEFIYVVFLYENIVITFLGLEFFTRIFSQGLNKLKEGIRDFWAISGITFSFVLPIPLYCISLYFWQYNFEYAFNFTFSNPGINQLINSIPEISDAIMYWFFIKAFLCKIPANK